MERLFERANHTQMALGSDLMKAALDGYAIMKVAGRADGLHSLKESLGARFNRRRRKKADEGSGDTGGDVDGVNPLTAA